MAKKKGTKPKKDFIDVTHEPHKLPCPVDEKGQAQAARDLAKAIQRLETLEGDRKAAAAGFKGEMDAIKQNVHNLSQKVNDGVEVKSVECELHLNHTKLTATLIRLDTNEVVNERPMTDEERQMKLDLDGAEKKAGKKAGKKAKN